VETLDLRRLGFSGVDAEATGRPGYFPGDLLKLYIYGYVNQIRSSRRLEGEGRRNLEVMWLTGRLSPSFKTIADFRKDHAEAIVKVCRAFIQFCRSQSLFGGELAAIDGTKIAAAASRRRAITAKALAKQIAALDRKLADHLKAMDDADRQEGAPAGRADVPAALQALKEQRAEIERQAEELQEQGLSQRVAGEEEARLMRTARHGHQVAYNAQLAVDAANKLIVAFELTNEGNDERQLQPMAEAAKAALGVECLTVIADTGYSNGGQGERCAAQSITAIVPRRQANNPAGKAYFSQDHFGYDAASDSYRCPAGQTLSAGKAAEGKKEYRTKACQGCPLKA
jgi:transposase